MIARAPGSRPRPLDLRYDVDADTVTIDGLVFSGDFFRAFHVAAGEARLVRIAHHHGAVWIEDPSAPAMHAAESRGIGPASPPSVPTVPRPKAAHLLLNGAPWCRRQLALLGACEHDTLDLAIAAMHSLREHTEGLEAVPGPCPHCRAQPAA